jgi:hypothetical protein
MKHGEITDKGVAALYAVIYGCYARRSRSTQGNRTAWLRFEVMAIASNMNNLEGQLPFLRES